MGRELKGEFLKKFREVIGLDSKYRAYVFLFVLLALYFIPISFLESNLNFSPCKFVLRESCPSKGIMRGVSFLLRGEIGVALSYNFLSIPTFFVMVFLIMIDFYFKIKTFSC